MRPRVRPALLAIALATSTLVPAQALAQPHPSASASANPPAVENVAADSPRASVKRFQDLCRAGEYAEASGYLDVPEPQRHRAAELARRLQAVLDREMRLKVERLSPESLGRRDDKLPPAVDEVGVIAGRSGPETVRLVRRATPDGIRWIFSRATVERVDAWFDRLQGRWFDEVLPPALLRQGPEELLVWQWIALPLLFAGSWFLGRMLAFATGRVARRVATRTNRAWAPHLKGRLAAPLALAWALTTVHFALPYLALASGAVTFLSRVLAAGGLVAFFWFLWRGVDVAGERLLDEPAHRGNAATRSLVPLGAKATKIVVFAIAVTAVFAELGYPVTSLVAGLGIGGVALALAAQKTVENLFGSVSIGLDRPFRVGDVIQVENVTGTVEAIGLRSTRVRTPDRTRVTMPNGKLADLRIECISDRDRMRFACTLGIEQSATPAQLRTILEGLDKALRKDPKTYTEGAFVALVRVGLTSLDIEVNAWFSTTDFDEFQVLRQAMLLRFLEVILASGTRLAAASPWPGAPLPAAAQAAPASPPAATR